ncbi:20151_t:CDS:2 [Gigaspora margarita]|uniref:20151_t:CDS:1 n=1 Tax=Gigaspora margarita TaxID=4874 RepID=A0ABM8VZD4_GIGMA|nr:20151_t:CDS:2 [Gigaspora margarita]
MVNQILKYRKDKIKKHLESNFTKWTTDNELIDKYIQQCQTENPIPGAIIEWVPFEKLENIKYKTKGGFGFIYTATWIDGWINDWNDIDQNFVRSGQKKIILKSLKGSNNPNKEYFKEAISHMIFSSLGSIGVKCYGLTKHPVSLEYMLIMKYMKNGDLNSFLLNKNNKFEHDTMKTDNNQSLLKSSNDNCEINGNNHENIKTEESLLIMRHIDISDAIRRSMENVENEPPQYISLAEDDLITLNLQNGNHHLCLIFLIHWLTNTTRIQILNNRNE